MFCFMLGQSNFWPKFLCTTFYGTMKWCFVCVCPLMFVKLVVCTKTFSTILAYLIVGYKIIYDKNDAYINEINSAVTFGSFFTFLGRSCSGKVSAVMTSLSMEFCMVSSVELGPFVSKSGTAIRISWFCLREKEYFAINSIELFENTRNTINITMLLLFSM